jgi:glyoxylase-like metal-dependent hydrolase (beta-lactamase superfamily II)
LPIKESGQLKFIDTPNADPTKLGEIHFAENFSVRFVNGHTQSMMLPQIKYKNQTIVFVADLLPSQGHIPIPYVMAYDMFPLTTLTEKKLFLSEAMENDYILFFEHDPVYECCNLQHTERGIRPKDFFKIEEVT